MHGLCKTSNLAAEMPFLLTSLFLGCVPDRWGRWIAEFQIGEVSTLCVCKYVYVYVYLCVCKLYVKISKLLYMHMYNVIFFWREVDGDEDNLRFRDVCGYDSLLPQCAFLLTMSHIWKRGDQSYLLCHVRKLQIDNHSALWRWRLGSQ